MNINIPKDSIENIFQYNKAKCHVCQRLLNFDNKEIMQGRFYYCNMKCYNFC